MTLVYQLSFLVTNSHLFKSTRKMKIYYLFSLVIFKTSVSPPSLIDLKFFFGLKLGDILLERTVYNRAFKKN